MVENKLDFVPVCEETFDALSYVFSLNLLPKAKEEYDIAYPGKEPLVEKVKKALKTLQDAFFIMFGGNILGVVGRKKIEQNGMVISCLFASTTKEIVKYPIQYYKAAKRFVDSMAKDSDVLLFSMPENFDRAISIIDRLGFTTISVDEIKGRKIVTKILRCDHGVDR